MKNNKRPCPHKFVPYRWDSTGMKILNEKCIYCGKIK